MQSRNFNPRPATQQQYAQGNQYRSSNQQPTPMPQMQQAPFQFGAKDQYIMYYSNYCINCKEFINILCKTPLYAKFTKVL